MSDHDYSGVGQEEQELLQSALASAFSTSPPETKRSVPTFPNANVASTSSSPAPVAEPEPAPSAPSTTSETPSSTLTDSWQKEYDSLLESWRSESSAQRTKAEESRAQWEALRASERKDRGGLTDLEIAVSSVRGPPNPRFEETSVKAETTVGEDEVEGEAEAEAEGEGEAVPDTQNNDDHNDSDTHPLGESYTTVSYPETSPGSEPVQPQSEPSFHEKAPASPNPPTRNPPPAGTLALFDSSLPLSTRALGLLSSLTINLLLPFVNGVMLGFGEIFARNVVLRFGWKVPGRFGNSTSGVGLRTSK